ncbi:MAG TPA: ATP-dependent DNA helicase RecG [Tepidisphaeraceae bacterium]|jgi:ATP-dependent DNA helicase RecG
MNKAVTDLSCISGIGPARLSALKSLGIHSVSDLLEYFPRDYRAESAEKKISDLGGEAIQQTRGNVVAVNYIPARPRPRFEATLEDETGKCALTWFNAQYLRRSIHPGAYLRVKGKVQFFRGIPQFVQPKWEPIDAATPSNTDSKFHAVYPASERMPSDVIARIIEEAMPLALPEIEEWFDGDLLNRHGLPGRREAFEKIHLPRNIAEAMRARRRLVYDELMLMQIGLGIAKKVRDKRLAAPILKFDKLLDQRIRQRFPFVLTAGQQNAIYDVLRDLASGQPMNRLLQGDVGSGKTSVALYAMLVAVANKMQAAILAPTEVLAEQHFLTLRNLLKDSNVRIELFTHRTKANSAKKKTGGGTSVPLNANLGVFGQHLPQTLLKDLSNGQIHIAIGTQALIQEDIEFANLGLVVVDEQHRLGVRQRAVLKSKGLSPHYLVMTATPIPRTLALSYFADFDVSTIDELPPGRQPIHTKWIRSSAASQAYQFIREEIANGRQAYIVLPQIDESSEDSAKSVVKEFERLSKGPLSDCRLAMLHGQMSPDEKQAVMENFRDRKTDVLVATTVIEVGIDVPNATVILIDNAERFGLSQLHQLRGRVGRGEHLSHCILISDADSDEARERLNAMTKTTSGFEIAEMDLKLRGPGEFFGTRQHGLPEFKLADITQEMELLSQAKSDAAEILEADPRLQNHSALRAAIKRQLGEVALSQIG